MEDREARRNAPKCIFCNKPVDTSVNNGWIQIPFVGYVHAECNGAKVTVPSFTKED